MKRVNYSELSNTQKLIFQKMKELDFDLGCVSLSQMSYICQCSENTILNLCKKMGFQGYKDLKQQLSCNPKLKFNFYYSNLICQDEDFSVVLEWQTQIYNSFKHLLLLNPIEHYIKQASRILNSRETLIFGHNVSAIPSQFLNHRLNLLHLKTSASRLGLGNDIRFQITRLGVEDLIIVFSFKPYYSRIINIVDYAKDNAIPVLSITDSYDSPASLNPETTILVKTGVPFFDNSLVCPIAICEILSTLIAIEMGDEAARVIKENGAINEYFSGNDIFR